MRLEDRIREIRETRDLDVALNAITDEVREIRLAAYLTVILMGESIATNELLTAFETEKDDLTRGAALIAIGVCSEEKRKDLFRPFLDDPEASGNMIAAACIAMCENGFEDEIEEIAEKHKSMRHREIASDILAKVREDRQERIEKMYKGITP